MANNFDVVIRGTDQSAAAFASLQKNVDAAAKQLSAMQSPIVGIFKTFESVKGGLQGLAALWAGNEALQWARRTAAAADETLALGHAMGFTADQIQAMQVAAAKNGTTLQEEAAFYGKNRALLDEMTESMRRQGMIMSGPTRQGFADINQEMEKVGRTWDALRASFGDTGMIGQGLGIIARMINDVGASLAYVETYRGTVGLIREIGAIITGGGGLVGVTAPERAAQFLGGLKKDALEAEAAYQKLDIQVRALQRSQEAAGNDAIKRQAQQIAGGGGTRQLTDMQEQLAAAAKRRDETTAAVQRAEAAIAKAESVTRTAQAAPFISTGKTADQLMGLDPAAAGGGGGGGGGGGSRDRIGENIGVLEAQVKATTLAYGQLQEAAKSALPLSDLQRAINLQRAITEETAKAAKAGNLDDKRREQIAQLVTEHETYKAKIDALNESLKLADATERQYGDGQKTFLQTSMQLKEALDNKRLSVGTYNLAIQELAKSTEDLRLKNQGLRGGMTGLIAGWQNAQNQFARANNEFAQGGQLFQGVVGLMDQSIQQFVQNGEINFNKLLQSFIGMLAQMSMRLAASQLTGLLGSALGGGGGTASGLLDGLFTATQGSPFMFAEGGRPPVGIPSWVGERGKELFVPDQSGTIYNQDQLDGMGGGVTIVQHMTFGSDVNRQTLISWGERVKAETISAIVLERRRGGPIKRAFA